MTRSRSFPFALAGVASFAIVGCHRSPATPQPAVVVASDNVDSQLARARADSIARADARRRDSIATATARADSLRRAADQARAVEAARGALLAPVYFDFDRAELRQPDRSILERKAAVLVANPSVRLRIEGNTDDRGSDEYNLALGMRRAAETKRFLLTRGVDSTRLNITSNGEEHATCHEADESCWSRNRRAEFAIIAGADRIVADRRRP